MGKNSPMNIVSLDTQELWTSGTYKDVHKHTHRYTHTHAHTHTHTHAHTLTRLHKHTYKHIGQKCDQTTYVRMYVCVYTQGPKHKHSYKILSYCYKKILIRNSAGCNTFQGTDHSS